MLGGIFLYRQYACLLALEWRRIRDRIKKRAQMPRPPGASTLKGESLPSPAGRLGGL